MIHAYRPEIDGLRAIAVLSVIFFHINATWLTGGFVGVDVFFVISGYLITNQIQYDIAAGTFTIKNFYLRRIRRILPPLLVMLSASTAAAFAILTPEDIRAYVNSLLVQPLSLQNVIFLSEGEYFIGADTKPLLHTWSLAVEEQFYFFWPILLLLMRRQSSKVRLTVVVLVIIGSFYVNLVQSQTAPKAAFFLIFSRAWELAIGGLAALTENRSWLTQKITRIHREGLLFCSALGLLIAFCYIDSSMLFPGKIALLPVVAVFFIIVFTHSHKTIVGKLLAHPLLVGIGLISYPLYLWHWPILVFMRHLHISTTQLLPIALFWLATFALAYSSYRWIETPIRRKIILKAPSHLLKTVALSFLGLIILGTHILTTEGASYRYSDKAKSFLTARINSRTTRCTTWSLIKDINPSICQLVESDTEPNRAKKIMIWGNSHAGMWLTMLEQLARENNAALFLNTKNCRPVVGQFDCSREIKAKVMAQIEQLQFDDIILVSSWQGIADPNLSKQLTELVERLAHKNIRVWLVIDPPIGDSLDPLAAYAKNTQNPIPGTIFFEDYNRIHRSNEAALFAQLKARFQTVNIIDPSDIFCDLVRCHGGNDKEVWYRDATHLNNSGALAARNKFAPIFHPR
jgi:peptidoglycan/LPS O-acetylase OafA/YrhL